MKNIYSAAEIRAVEQAAFAGGITEDELIERAAEALAEEVRKLTFSRAVIFAGGGNNGSDALSLALRLLRAGVETAVFMTSARRNAYVEKRLAALEKMRADVRDADAGAAFELRASDLVVDGMLGIGCARDVTGATAAIIAAINAAACRVVAVDIPTGLNADTGRVMGAAVEADLTVTFSALKLGLLLSDGRNYTGEVVVREIGLTMPAPRVGVLEAADIALPARKPVSNKGTYGSVAVIAGSPTMIGASLLAHESACAALRSGAGYALLCVPDSLKSVYQQRVKEELLCFLPDADGKILCDIAALAALLKARAIVIGMGLGKNDATIEIIRYLAHNFDGALVVDGDGLNALAAQPQAVAGHKCKLILTPHVREFARLEAGVCGGVSAAPDTERCTALARELDAVVAMKSATTVISDGSTVMLNVTGTPAMAKAGSGDVLAGMTGAFAANADPLTAVLRACYEFGKAGERAALARGETSVIASDIIVRL